MFGLPALVTLFVAYLIDKRRKHLLSRPIRIASWIIAIIAYVAYAIATIFVLENDEFEEFLGGQFFFIFLGPPILSLIIFYFIQQLGQKKNNNETDLKN